MTETPLDHLSLRLGSYHVYVSRDRDDIARAQAFRHMCFQGGEGLDADRFDADAHHVLIEDQHGALAGCYRMLIYQNAPALLHGYSAQFYDLTRLAHAGGPVIELGRFCLRADLRDPDLARIGWGVLTGVATRLGAVRLVGCCSFAGTDAAPYVQGFAYLNQRALAPAALAPAIRAPEVIRFADAPHMQIDPQRAKGQLPPLLRNYLSLGGWVSDHAVVDRGFGTLHVLTAVDIANIPKARARSLRALMRTGAA